MSEEVVNSDSDVRKRRKSGEGSLKTYNKKLKSEGKAYKNYNNQTVPAKKPPKEEVGIEQLRITVIWLTISYILVLIYYFILKKYAELVNKKVLRGTKNITSNRTFLFCRLSANATSVARRFHTTKN